MNAIISDEVRKRMQIALVEASPLSENLKAIITGKIDKNLLGVIHEAVIRELALSTSGGVWDQGHLINLLELLGEK